MLHPERVSITYINQINTFLSPGCKVHIKSCFMYFTIELNSIQLTEMMISLIFYIVNSCTGKPPPPKFTVKSTSPSSLTITIRPVRVPGLQGYKVQHQEIGGKKIQKIIGDVTEYVIQGKFSRVLPLHVFLLFCYIKKVHTSKHLKHTHTATPRAQPHTLHPHERTHDT